MSLCALVIIFILFQSLIFIRTAWLRGLEIGLDKGVMKKTMTNAAVFSVVPSLAIIVMLAVLTNNLGKYFPWLRLSVVGSAKYENIRTTVSAITVILKLLYIIVPDLMGMGK